MNFFMVRAAERNLLNVDAGSIRSLSNPLLDVGEADGGAKTLSCVEMTQEPCAMQPISQGQRSMAVTSWARNFLSRLPFALGKQDGPGVPSVRTRELDISQSSREERAAVQRGRRLWVSRSGGPSKDGCFVELRNKAGRLVAPALIREVVSVGAMAADSGMRRRLKRSELPFTGIVARYKLADSPTHQIGHVYSNCKGWLEPRSSALLATSLCQISSLEEYRAYDKVLDALAATFTDAWPFAPSGAGFDEGSAAALAYEGLSAYDQGISGIWRKSADYTYVEARTQSDEVDLSSDGVLEGSGVPVFDWTAGDTSSSCLPKQKWRLQQQVEAYSPDGMEVQARNAVDVPSSALYGYGRSLPIVVANNAEKAEIGFEGFEEYVAGDEVADGAWTSGNISFHTKEREPDNGREIAEVHHVRWEVSQYGRNLRLLPAKRNLGGGRPAATGGAQPVLRQIGISDPKQIASLEFFPASSCPRWHFGRGTESPLIIEGIDPDNGVIVLGAGLLPECPPLPIGGSQFRRTEQREDVLKTPVGPEIVGGVRGRVRDLLRRGGQRPGQTAAEGTDRRAPISGDIGQSVGLGADSSRTGRLAGGYEEGSPGERGDRLGGDGGVALLPNLPGAGELPGVGGELPGGCPTPEPGESPRDYLDRARCYGVVDIGIEVFPVCPPFCPQPEPIVEVTDDKAHTGINSLKVHEATTYAQRELQLEASREYVLSYWVSREDADTPSFVGDDPPSNSRLGIMVLDGETGQSLELAERTGPVVEGWQQVDATFEATPGVVNPYISTIRLKFVNGIGATGQYEPAYFDDIRVHPSAGSYNSYVYDPATYRLRAVLDENNFATFYDYDEEGALYLLSKETVEGIRAIQEMRQHRRERPGESH